VESAEKSLVWSTLASRPCALHAPLNVRSFPDAGLQDFENDGSPFRSSAVLDVVRHQLAGPGRNLGPPCIPGSVCRKVRPLLDLAVCIPSEQSHRTPLSHLKGSELFETLPCESGATIGQRQVGRIDFATCMAIGFVFSTLERGDRSDRGCSIPACCALVLVTDSHT
jgi:hypothetical protein